MPLPLPLTVLPIKHGYLNFFQKRLGKHYRITGIYKWLLPPSRWVFPWPPMEALFKDCYVVSGSDIGSGSGIAKWFKDPDLINIFYSELLSTCLSVCFLLILLLLFASIHWAFFLHENLLSAVPHVSSIFSKSPSKFLRNPRPQSCKRFLMTSF